MKQLYAAGSLAFGAGASNDPSAGIPSVRAVTTGVSPEEIASVLPLAGYRPPPGRPTESDSPLPVRLALLQSATAGRVLAHVAPLGDKFFAHAVLQVPTTADAQLAIQTWGSLSWHREDVPVYGDLPELPYLPVADVLDDAVIQEWLKTAKHRELLEFVLTALLTTAPHTRVFVAAPSEDVAKVVYAVTRALPPGMLEDFTFSTYEPDPRTSPARLVGHDTGSPEWDLPSECYSEGGVAFNLATGRISLTHTEVPFSDFAANALATGEFAPLDEFKATWQRLGMTGARQFDLVFRLARGTGVLTKEETAEALQYPPLTQWVSGRADAQKQFLEWALDDQHFATAAFSRVVQSLRQKPDVIAKLAQTVRDEGTKALKLGQKDRTANALEIILPMVAPAKANAIWGDLLGGIPDPSGLAWEMRWYLLSRFVRYKQQQNPAAANVVDPAFAKWVDVPGEKLGELLAVEVPRAYHLAGARACLAKADEPSALYAQTVARQPSLALTLLQPTDPKSDEKSTKLYDALLAEAPAQSWFEDMIGKADDYPAALRNKFFEATLTADKIDADHLIRTAGSRVLELFAGQSGLDRLGKQFLASPPADLLHNPGILEFLGKLKDESPATAELKERIAAVEAVRAYLDAPTFTAEAMKPTADAFALSPPVLPPTAKGEVFSAVSAELQKRAADSGLQDDLEAVLIHFGPVLANDPADLFENLLRDLRGRVEFSRNVNLLHTFLGVALGAAKSPELAGKLDGLDVQAFALAADAAKKGKSRLLDELDARTEPWPKAAKAQWGFLRAAVQPQGAKRLLRDAAFLLLGAALGAGGLFAYLKFAVK